ncbi:MAG: precorrin-6A reductase [Firmicutes bacterium]|nr:precorrin-6A reductase [Bacillota bacterium]
MADKICIFAGTKDGREMAGLLAGHGLDVTACAATEYGGELLEAGGDLKVRTGRMDEEEMEVFLKDGGFDLVIDATHPYAQIVTENIRNASKAADIDYLRLLRAQEDVPGNAVYLEDTEEAVRYLSETSGQILLTTGSKELVKYSEIPGFGERVWARVLPLESSLKQAEEAGLPAGRIIAMQGPFTKEMNIAMLNMTKAEFMVTKQSGKIGGFGEKMDAALECDITAVVIGRPPEEGGMSFSKMAEALGCGTEEKDEKVEIKTGCTVKNADKSITEYRFDVTNIPCVSIAGIGMGMESTMTSEVKKAIEEAECLIGAERMLDAAKKITGMDKPSVKAIAPEMIKKAMMDHPEYHRFCVLMSGDTGFFSGTKKLLPMLKEAGALVSVLPGISSMSYLASRAGESYDDCKMVSMHGRSRNIAADVRNNRKVFCLVGGQDGAADLIETLVSAGLGKVTVCVGERLGYTDEMVTTGPAEKLTGRSFDSLSAVLIINEEAGQSLRFGFPDSAFTRGGDSEGVVPMTKSEVRAAVLSKLQPFQDDLCWDIGAGTGSVSIELALNAPYGTTYAVEKKEKALELLNENIAKFGASNCIAVPGSAPEALTDLPAPDKVFIGGSSGNMEEIIRLVLDKNPEARIVAAAVSLETIAELSEIVKKFDFEDREVVCLSVARAREIGKYNLMMGQNPIYIFTMQKTPCTSAGDTAEGKC